jgi:N-acetylmuramoyl-L-alanine amidase
MKEGRNSIREREWLRLLPPTVAGARVFFDADCRDVEESRQAWEAATAAALAVQEAGGLPMMSRSQDTQLPERVRARRANRMGSDIIVVFRSNREGEDSVYYFASEHSSSAAGRELANAMVSVIGGRVEGRASAMLKETRAPAVVVVRRQLDEKLGIAVSEAIDRFFATAAATK